MPKDKLLKATLPSVYVPLGRASAVYQPRDGLRNLPLTYMGTGRPMRYRVPTAQGKPVSLAEMVASRRKLNASLG